MAGALSSVGIACVASYASAGPQRGGPPWAPFFSPAWGGGMQPPARPCEPGVANPHGPAPEAGR